MYQKSEVGLSYIYILYFTGRKYNKVCFIKLCLFKKKEMVDI